MMSGASPANLVSSTRKEEVRPCRTFAPALFVRWGRRIPRPVSLSGATPMLPQWPRRSMLPRANRGLADCREAGYKVPEALARAAARGSSIDISPSWASVARRQALARSVLNTSAAKYNATIIDPLPALCDDNRCYVERNGIILYHDTNHLSGTGAESISYIYDGFFKGLSDKGTVAHAQHDKRAGAEFGTSAIPGLRCFPQQFCQSQKSIPPT